MKNKLYKNGLEEYPKLSILLGNFLIILWIVIGTIACWFLHPLAALVYFAFAVIMVFIVLRKLLCTNCYYYNKWCCMGWGKCSAILFRKGDIKQFNISIGQKLAPLTYYGLLSVAPVIFIVTSIFKEFAISKIIVLAFLLIISFYSGAIGRKKSCAKCKMKLICPGSAVK